MTRESLRILQLNLCNSGEAGCYTGRSVRQAATLFEAASPDVVTLNEVCQRDVDVLKQTLAGRQPGGRVVAAFQPAFDRRTGSAYRCRNGQPYGVGMLVRLPARSPGYTTSSGIYPSQDRADPEERAWLCVRAVTRFDACTTHLASRSATVALAQCRYLLDSALPATHRGAGSLPTLLGGDLNLTFGGSPDLHTCVPPGYLHTDDGGVQQILATGAVTVSSRMVISLHGATDHPGLLVTLTTTR